MTAADDTPRPAALAALFALSIAAHGATLGNGFVFDDTFAVVNNPVVTGEVPWTAAFTTDFWGLTADAPGRVGTWRPVPVLLSRALYAVGVGAPFPFHLGNVVLHALAVVMLTLAASRATRSARVGVLTGALFATLSVNTEAVAGIVGSADLLAALCSFAAWAALGSPDAETPPRALLLSTMATFGAGLSKESALVFPALIVAIDVLVAGPQRRLLRRAAALGLGASLALLARQLAWGSFSLVTGTTLDNPLLLEGLGVRVLTGLALFTRATGLILAPLELSSDYSFESIVPARSPFEADVLLALALVAGLVTLSVMLRRRLPGVAAASVLFAGGFFIVSNIPAALPSIFAERLLYLPAAGAALGLGVAFDQWAKSRANLAVPVLVTFVLLQGARGASRDLDWRSDLSLFGKAVETQPRCARAWANYGLALAHARRHTEAFEAYSQALAIAPAFAPAHTRAAISLDALARAHEAEAHFREAVRLAPLDETSVNNYAVFLAQHGRLAEGAAVLRPLVERHPTPGSRRLLEAIERGLHPASQ